MGDKQPIVCDRKCTRQGRKIIMSSHFSGQEGSLYVSWFNFIVGFKFIFLCLKQIDYHTLSYPKTKEHKIETKDKIEPQHTPNCIHVVIKKAKDK